MREQPYTKISSNAWDRLIGQEMTPGEAVLYFSSNLQPRTFGSVLSALMKARQLNQETLLDRLLLIRSHIQKDSLRKRIQVWLKGGQPSERVEWFQLCYALGLNETEAREFLCHCQEGGFHLREPREAGYLYGLRSGKSYQEIQAFISELPNIDGPFPTVEASSENYTRTVEDSFAQVHTDAEFRAFIQKNQANFGTLHNTAYRYFTSFFEELIRPTGPCSAEEDEAYSIEKVVDTYLRMGLPSDRKTSGYSPEQKAIKRLWPNATAVKNMRNRKIDVSRKVLLLLYLVTEGLDDGAIEESMGWELPNRAARLEEHSWNIDLMLHECGYAPLDPRNPFDWLVLYSLRTDGETEAMSDRLASILTELFPAGEAGREVDVSEMSCDKISSKAAKSV